ncbi:MAG TPA: GNAT family N-acetyltransferase, partial [Rudaea sp.]
MARAQSRARNGGQQLRNATMTISIIVGDAPQTEHTLAQCIYEFNAQASGRDDAESFSAMRNDPHGEIEAGVCGYTWGGCCFVSYLWVAAPLRGAGVGRALLSAVEEHARKRGCRIV